MAHYGPTNPPEHYDKELNQYETICTECRRVCDIDGMMPGEETCWPCWIRKEPEDQAEYGDFEDLIEQYKEWRCS